MRSAQRPKKRGKISQKRGKKEMARTNEGEGPLHRKRRKESEGKGKNHVGVEQVKALCRAQGTQN